MANLLLSAWTATIRPVLNYDAILYITAAQAISEGNWQYASELYRGALYPFLIYITSVVSTFNLENSAHLLNSIFITLLSLGFIAIVRELSGKNKEIMIVSALVIIFFPSLLKFRPFIIRDFGFLACYLWSIYFLLKYRNQHTLKYFTAWSFILIFSAFIRIESVAYLILISTFLIPWKRSLSDIKFFTFFALACTMALGLLIIQPSWLNADHIHSIHPSLAYPFEYIDTALSRLNKSILDGQGYRNFFISLFKVTANTIYETLRRLEFIYAIFAFIAIKKGLVFNNQNNHFVFTSYVITSLIILVLFTISAGYTTSRYTMALVLTILTLAPFTLNYLYKDFQTKPRSIQAGLIFLAISLCFLSFNRLTPNDRHLEHSVGNWILKNTPSSSIVVSNNTKVLYYARQQYRYHPINNRHHRFNTQYLIAKINFEQFKKSDYLAFMVRSDDKKDVKQEKVFINKFGNPIKKITQHDKLYVSIFKLK